MALSSLGLLSLSSLSGGSTAMPRGQQQRPRSIVTVSNIVDRHAVVLRSPTDKDSFAKVSDLAASDALERVLKPISHDFSTQAIA